jgi:hypothetical protein
MNEPDGTGATSADGAKYRLLRYAVAEHEIARNWKAFEDAGLSPLLIKGWAAAQYYRDPSERHLGDIDLAFAPEEYAPAEELRARLQLLRTDLHRGLRHLDTLPWDVFFRRAQTAECAGARIRVPAPEDHLRVLSVHWLNDGGAYRGKLADISNLLASAGAGFDWELCLAGISATRRRWIAVAVSLAARESGSVFAGHPFTADELRVPAWIDRALEREWASGAGLVPLHFVLRDPRRLWVQIRKRIPPNALQATVETEGPFDDSPRILYQLKNAVRRVRPSFARVWPAIFRGRGERRDR